MPRDVNGVYTLPAGNPVAAGTLIEADWCNTTMLDIAAALNTPPPVIEIPVEVPDGTETNPGLTFANEPTTGLWRDGFQDVWFVVGAEGIFNITGDGVELAPGKTALGFLSGAAATELEVSGECFLGKQTSGAGPVEELSYPEAAALIEPFLDLEVGKAHGQCQLVRDSATTLALVRFSGQGGLIIDGEMEEVPVIGVGITNAGLSANTTYMVYAFMNLTTMTLELSTTLPVDDEGIMIKSGDATRTLVGMVRTNASTQFTDSLASRLTRTWFNDKGVSGGATEDISGQDYDYGPILSWPEENFHACNLVNITAGPAQGFAGVVSSVVAIDASAAPVLGSSITTFSPGDASVSTGLTWAEAAATGANPGAWRCRNTISVMVGGSVLATFFTYALGGSGA